ncbi:hypothetical protein D3C84_1252530 [compost metagenome]
MDKDAPLSTLLSEQILGYKMLTVFCFWTGLHGRNSLEKALSPNILCCGFAFVVACGGA